MHNVFMAPTRVFFPMGIFLAAAGLYPWLLQLWPNAPYPIDYHRMMMIDGFALAIVSGLVLNNFPAKTWEVYALTTALLAAAAAASLSWFSTHCLVAALAVLLLIFSITSRKTEQKNYVLLAGLFSWLLSLIILSNHFAGADLLYDWTSVIADIHSNGALTAVILGLGPLAAKNSHKHQFVALILFLSSFLLIRFLPLETCLGLRALAVSYFSVGVWHIHKLPEQRDSYSWGLWLSRWCFVLGYFLTAIWSTQYIHALHAVLVGGITLFLLLHSHFILTRIKSSRKVTWITAVILGGAATRVFAPIIPQIYLRHLAYSAIMLFLGLGIWLWSAKTHDK